MHDLPRTMAPSDGIHRRASGPSSCMRSLLEKRDRPAHQRLDGQEISGEKERTEEVRVVL